MCWKFSFKHLSAPTSLCSISRRAFPILNVCIFENGCHIGSFTCDHSCLLQCVTPGNWEQTAFWRQFARQPPRCVTTAGMFNLSRSVIFQQPRSDRLRLPWESRCLIRSSTENATENAGLASSLNPGTALWVQGLSVYPTASAATTAAWRK